MRNSLDPLTSQIQSNEFEDFGVLRVYRHFPHLPPTHGCQINETTMWSTTGFTGFEGALFAEEMYVNLSQSSSSKLWNQWQ